jgi:ribonuclease BN (tRNA processing enzyme)
VIAYVTDTEPFSGQNGHHPSAIAPDPNVLQLARDADVLIHDAQYTDEEYPSKVGWGHSPISYVIGVAAAARVKHLILFHHDPLRTDDQVEAQLSCARQMVARVSDMRLDAATEGMTLALGLSAVAAL